MRWASRVTARSGPCAPSTTSPVTGRTAGRTWRLKKGKGNDGSQRTGPGRSPGVELGGALSRLRAEATDRSVAQVAEKVREIGTKLSTQMDQQAGALGKLEEAIKHSDLQMRALSAEVNRFQGVLAEFDKVLRALNDKAIDVDRRVTELTGRIEVKVGTLATQQGDQAVRLDALEKTVAAAVATVNENSRGLGELKRSEEHTSELQS